VLPAGAAVPVPAGWADEQALGMVVNWPTALAALKPLGGIDAGQTATVGITPYFIGSLGGSCMNASLPPVGATMVTGQQCGELESLTAIGPVHAPPTAG
jgi:NADPH:quinone reductase